MLKLDKYTKSNLLKVSPLVSKNIVLENLTRMGIGNHVNKSIWQSCHLLELDGHFYIVHYKEIFYMLNREVNWRVGDIERRNKIAILLVEWGLISVHNDMALYDSPYYQYNENEPVNVYKIRHAEKSEYIMDVKCDVKTFMKLAEKQLLNGDING